MKSETITDKIEETLTHFFRNIRFNIEELRAKIFKATKELALENSRYRTNLVEEFKEAGIKLGRNVDSKYGDLLAELFKELKELKHLAGKVSAEMVSKSIDFITERVLFFQKLLILRGLQKNKNISESDLQSVLEAVSFQEKDMNLAKHSAETILFSMYGQVGMKYNKLSFKLPNVLLVVTLLGLCIALAIVVFESKARKLNRITLKSGATMYFVLGRSKLFSSEVFGEALMISILIGEQNGSNEQSGLQIAYTLLFPNDCRMFLYIPIYLHGYLHRTEHKNNTIPIITTRQERHTDGAVMPNHPGWRGALINN